MIIYKDKYDYIINILKNNIGKFSLLLVRGDYGKGKTSLINSILDNMTNLNLLICKYPGMNTPFEEMTSALFQKLEENDYGITDINTEISHREYLKQVFINICKQTPDIIVVFRDMRDYDSNTIELIKEIVNYLENHQIACHIIMEYSTDNLTFEQRDQLMACVSMCTIPEIKLETKDYKIYIPYFKELLAGKSAITLKQIESIVKESFFNPAMIKKMLYYFIDVGIFFQHDGCWYSDEIDFQLTTKLFEKNIYQRYEKLDDVLKTTLNKASITGYEINTNLLYQPFGIIKSEDNLRRIERLSRLITHTEQTYEFENNTVYNLVLESISPSERKALHSMIASYLYEKVEYYIKTDYSNLLHVLYIIKEHYLNANQIEPALHIIACYIEQAYHKRNYDTALSGIKEFINLSAGKYPFSEQQMMYMEAEIYSILGRFSSAHKCLASINKKYLPNGNSNWILYREAYNLFCSGKREESKEKADTLNNKQITDSLLQIKLNTLLAGMYHHFGDVRYAARCYEYALSSASNNIAYYREYNYLLLISNMFLDNVLAIPQIEKSMCYFKENNLLISYAKGANNVAINYIYTGDFKTSTDYLKKSYKVFSDIHSISAHYPLNNLATIYGHLQEYKEAERIFSMALQDDLEPFSRLWISINIAHCKRKLGEYQECEYIINNVENELYNLEKNAYLLKRNLYIARGLLQLDKNEYLAAYENLVEALHIELLLLHNDTYPIFISKLLIQVSDLAQCDYPKIAEPYKSSNISLFIQNLLDNRTHWGNFLFWEL